ncbi:MAG: hypothetical protein IKN57_11840, partial [Parasporobacterium sp.]|nr:hypothetical protein [Parasporobacterium sp.]
MEGIWIIPGAVLIAIGLFLLQKSVLSAAAPLAKTMLPSALRVAAASVPGIVAALAASMDGQSTFLLTFLIGFCYFGILLSGSIYGIAHSFYVDRVIFFREYPVILSALLMIVVYGRSTFGTGHPEVILGKGTGFFMLFLFALELFLMSATVMRGYPPEPPAKKERIPILVFFALGG